MQLFYTTNFKDNIAILSAEESAHCIRVLRFKKGDSINLMDGNGNLFDGTIENPDPKQCKITITSARKVPSSRRSRLHIAIAPTKNLDRFEWFVEKAVEIGIDEITPLLCEHSERRILKTDRLEKLIISTMKQAKVFQKPQLNNLTEFGDFMEIRKADNPQLFIAHCIDQELSNLPDQTDTLRNSIILIGPEGDFTSGEIKKANDMGYKSVSLGPTRLRTETAGIVACVMLNFS